MSCNLRFHPSLNGFVSLEPHDVAGDSPQVHDSDTQEPAESEMRPPMMAESEVLPLRPIPGGARDTERPDTTNGTRADFASSYCAAHHLRPE
jgi:hypothetical protein